MRRPSGGVAWLAGLLAVATLGLPAVADDVPGQEPIVITPKIDPRFAAIRDPVIRDMLALDAIAPFEDLAPLWDWKDRDLQAALDAAMDRLDLDDDVRRRRLAIALVDLSDEDEPKVATVNGDTMMYAASLPKIAVLLGAFEKIAVGEMEFSDENRRLMEEMIRRSNNRSTTELMHRVGKKYIARVLLSPRYRLYDPRRNGGLWVGKDYAKAGLWKRDPIHNLSHGATAMQVARFYYLLWTDNLVTPEYSRKMKDVMSGEHLNHKFVKALSRLTRPVRFFRKSGSWRTYHSDSALVQRGDRAYIAVALSNDPNGGRWMSDIITAMDEIVAEPKKKRRKKARKS